MIKKITVLSATEPSLDSLLPSGLEVDTDSKIVYLVGLNRTGKTAFLRLVQSSLLNKQFYDMYGKMRIADFLNIPWSLSEYESKDLGLDPGLYNKLHPNSVHVLRSYKKVFPEFSFSEKKDLTDIVTETITEDVEIPITENQYYMLVQSTADIFRELDISQFLHVSALSANFKYGEYQTTRDAAYDAMGKQIMGRLQEIYPDIKLDQCNFPVHSYIEAFEKGDDFFKDYWDWRHNYLTQLGVSKEVDGIKGSKVIKKDRMEQLLSEIKDLIGQKSDATVWTYFKPETADAPVFPYEASPAVNLRNSKKLVPEKEHYFGGGDEIVINHLVWDPTWEEYERHSSGSYVMSAFGQHFEIIDDFFEKRWLPMPQYLKNLNVEGKKESNIQAALKKMPKVLSVPSDAEMAFFVDEPTVYLDKPNRKKLTEQLFGLVKKHPGLQLFMATNSDDLIRAAPKESLFLECNSSGPMVSNRSYLI